MIVDWFRKEQRGKKKILFFALETYSLIGGLQSFNRRLIKHLGLYTISNKYNAAYVGVLRDGCASIPSIPGVKI
jgi:hypothetical protein